MKASPTQEKHQSSLTDDYLFELQECVRQTINEAEKNGDSHKRNEFLALRAELL